MCLHREGIESWQVLDWWTDLPARKVESTYCQHSSAWRMRSSNQVRIRFRTSYWNFVAKWSHNEFARFLIWCSGESESVLSLRVRSNFWTNSESVWQIPTRNYLDTFIWESWELRQFFQCRCFLIRRRCGLFRVEDCLFCCFERLLISKRAPNGNIFLKGQFNINRSLISVPEAKVRFRRPVLPVPVIELK